MTPRESVGRYRKKPVEIEAMRLGNENAGRIVEWIVSRGGTAVMRGGPGGGSRKGTVYIETLEGTHHASLGDYVICGVQGEFYPCKPDIFEATYETVDPTLGRCLCPVGFGQVAAADCPRHGVRSPAHTIAGAP